MEREWRAAVDEALSAGRAAGALAIIERRLNASPSIADAQFAVERMRSLTPDRPRAALRLAILRSFTIEPAVPLLKALALLRGIELEVWIGGFNTYAQEMLDPDSSLYRFDPNVVLLAVQTCDIAPELWDPMERPDAKAARRVVDVYRQLIDAFRLASSASLMLQGLEVNQTPAAGILDSQSAAGQSELVREVNRGLVELAQSTRGVHFLDYDALTARHGKLRWRDERKWFSARMPVSADCLAPYARECVRFLVPIAGRSAKVLVVDLDNTLWGGVVGEVGAGNLEIGTEYPGVLYRNLQRAILSIRSRGVMLAIASKNDEAVALDAIDGHRGMVLRSRDFVARRINWNDKARSLREIAGELNVGIDSLVFLDDSPVEREGVRTQLPEVTVIEPPDDLTAWPAHLLEHPLFERLAVVAEDRDRQRINAEQRQRAQLEREAPSLEGFLRSLEMEMEMREVDAGSIARVAQLTQKTNQFNLTTRRYNDEQIARLAASAHAKVYQVSLRDRFGDSGIIGVAITKDAGDAWEIDTLLLSCRVIGRTVENAMLAKIADDAVAAGARHLAGWCIATVKNEPARGFYAANGFTRLQSSEDRALWQLDLSRHHPVRPDWIRVPEPVM